MSDNPKWEIIQGDALKLLGDLPPGSFDAVITDPPYASGGRYRYVVYCDRVVSVG